MCKIINMDVVTIDYRKLTNAALIKIFELADQLNRPPKEVAKTWLLFQAEKGKDPSLADPVLRNASATPSSLHAATCS